ncbi:MAG: FecR domain-containing protein [Marinobacter sp.]|uniref:FecR family protein n=1 Tax=Marinobacter sp. TaxID=50741 RepID=UPI00299E92D4|nr:FecR domain-containing protein [Marinobacter sp.]MDX1633619.1 FecR domain-containing protein [Marinobacter sp.]
MIAAGINRVLPTLLAVFLVCTGARAELPVTTGSHAGYAAPMGDDRPEWRYSLQAGESLSQVASDLLSPQYTSQQLAQYNRIGNPALLKGGDRIRIPLLWLKRQPEPATLVAASGQGYIRLGGNGQTLPLEASALLRAGDEVVTQSGNATLRLADGSTVRVHPNSHLILNRLTQYGRSGMVDTRLRLERGQVSTEVEPLVEGGARFEIETPSAVSAVRGTRFSLESTSGVSRLRVTEGTVAFGPIGRSQPIPAGYSATVDARTPRLLDIRRLPPAPQTQPLPDQLTRLPVTLAWADDGAPAHQLEVFDAETGHPVLSRRTQDTSMDLGQLDNGRYRVQVSALTGSGVPGLASEQEIDVALQAMAAELVSPAPGATVDDDMPEFRWELRSSNEVARLEVSEREDFGTLVASSEWAEDTSALPSRPLSPGQYYWRVVTEAGGNSVASTEPRAVVVNGTLPPARIININYIDSQVRIFWQRVDTANNYLLQLAEDPSFRNIVKEATVGDTTAALRLIPGRRYFVRLKALSEGPLASRWGPGRELFIE